MLPPHILWEKGPGKNLRFFPFDLPKADQANEIIFAAACTWRKFPDPCARGAHTPVADVTGGGGSTAQPLAALPLYGCGVPLAGKRNARKEEPVEHW